MTDDDKQGRIFDQWCEDFRSLQSVFWRVPFFAMTITGGIGAAIIAFEGGFEIKRLLLAFVGICNFILIMIAWRVRQIMETLLIKIYKYEDQTKGKSGFFVLKCFSTMFAIVGILSIYLAIFPGQLLKATTTPTESITEEIQKIPKSN